MGYIDVHKVSFERGDKHPCGKIGSAPLDSNSIQGTFEDDSEELDAVIRILSLLNNLDRGEALVITCETF